MRACREGKCRSCQKNQPRRRGLCETCHARHSADGTLDQVGTPPKRTTDDLLDGYAELRAQQVMQKDIAGRLGVSMAYLARILAQAARAGDPRSDLKLRKPAESLPRAAKPLPAEVNARWYERARCSDADVNLFFKHESEPKGEWIASSRQVIKTYCDGCSVRLDCLQVALTNGEEGIWGGTTETARKEMGSVRYSNVGRAS